MNPISPSIGCLSTKPQGNGGFLNIGEMAAPHARGETKCDSTLPRTLGSDSFLAFVSNKLFIQALNNVWSYDQWLETPKLELQ